MKLFGRDKKLNVEELISEDQLPEMKMKDAADAEEVSNFVMSIEGLDLRKEEETVPDLRGATKTLPDQDQIQEALETVSVPENPSAEETEPEAAETTDPVEDIEAAEPAEPAESAESAEPAEPVEPAESAESAEPAEPAEPAEAAEPAEPAEPAKPAEQVEPAEASEDKLSSVSYASVAQAMVNAKKEPTGRYDRDAIDDETLLAELYALIGDKNTKKNTAPTETAAAVQPQTRPAPRTVARITPETLQAAPEEFIEVEEDTSGVPGWLKGVFILLISLLLSAMTFYAVASDVIGKIF